jgi:hypothetical protein
MHTETLIDLTTYIMDLDELDKSGATFRHQLNNARAFVVVTIDRERWESLGRPARIEVEPKPVAP